MRMLAVLGGLLLVSACAKTPRTPAAPSPTQSAAAVTTTTAPNPAQTLGSPSSAPSTPAAPRVHTTTLGTSVRGRPITAIELGDPAAVRRLVVVGCIHGDEPGGIAIAGALERLVPPAGVDVWVIPDLNPDGVAAHTRQNADGIDLNRNFPYNFTELESPGGLMYSGTSPLSEPESKAAAAFLQRVRPTVTIWYHQAEDLVDLSGGDAGIEQRYAAAVGLPARQLTRYPGSVASWENVTFPGTTAFVVELPAGSPSRAQARRHAAAALATVS